MQLAIRENCNIPHVGLPNPVIICIFVIHAECTRKIWIAPVRHLPRPSGWGRTITAKLLAADGELDPEHLRPPSQWKPIVSRLERIDLDVCMHSCIWKSWIFVLLLLLLFLHVEVIDHSSETSRSRFRCVHCSKILYLLLFLKHAKVIQVSFQSMT